MRWVFDSKASGGLKIISEIPNLTPCLIEGRNGVGKTVSIQLLELISGKIPVEFSGQDDLWASLRDRINDTQITGTELRGARRIEVTFTPTRWPVEAPDEVGPWLGSCLIDGSDTDLSRVASLVSVEHISGTEDLAATIDRHRASLEGQLASTARLLRQRTAAVKKYADELLTSLSRADPGDIAKEEHQVSEDEDELRTRRVTAQQIAIKLQTLVRGTELRRKRDALDQDSEVLLRQRSELVSQVNELERSLVEAQDRAAELFDAVATEGDVGAKLASTQRLLRTRSTRAAKARRELERHCLNLGIDLDEPAVTAAEAACIAEITKTQARMDAADAGAELRALVDHILPPLRVASERLGTQILADGFTPPLSITAAVRGLDDRRSDISSQPAPAEVRELNEALNGLVSRRGAIHWVSTHLASLRRDDELVTEAESEYQSMTAQVRVASVNGKLSRDAHQEVGRLQTELSSTHAELAGLQQRLNAGGMLSRDDADLDIAAAESVLGVPQDQWQTLESILRDESAAADDLLARAERALALSRRRLASQRAAITETLEQIRDDPRYSWLLDPLPHGSDELETRYARSREAVMSVIHNLEAAETSLVTLQGLSQAALEPRAEESALLGSSRDLVVPFREVLGARLTATLNRAAIRSRVFDGATVKGIDPANRTVTLVTKSGETSSRPLATFSTGERAFAFTQARIADIEPAPQLNKLLFLDEFGAYVSADRLPDLASFLASDIVGPIADQIVVVLPLHVDYATEVANTRGELRERYEARLAEIEQRGYCAVPLR